MSLTITKVDVWAAEIDDTPGGLAKLLGALAGAGADLECVIARRDPTKTAKVAAKHAVELRRVASRLRRRRFVAVRLSSGRSLCRPYREPICLYSLLLRISLSQPSLSKLERPWRHRRLYRNRGRLQISCR